MDTTSVARRVKAFLKSVLAYQRAFGWLRGGALLVAAQFPRPANRRVELQGPNGRPVSLRAGTADVDVFCQVMLDQEYDFDLGAKPRVIIDAGAHIGLASVWFATRYPDAVIVAVEPEADNFEMLVANTVAYPNVRAVHAALWVTDGTVDLQDPGIGTWGFRVGDDAHGGSHGVRAVTVDGLMAEFDLDHVDLLKLDVEGAEIELLSDCSGWIDSVDAIITELHDWFRPGCSRAFFAAVTDFPVERRNGENVFVTRT